MSNSANGFNIRTSLEGRTIADRVEVYTFHRRNGNLKTANEIKEFLLRGGVKIVESDEGTTWERIA